MTYKIPIKVKHDRICGSATAMAISGANNTVNAASRWFLIFSGTLTLNTKRTSYVNLPQDRGCYELDRIFRSTLKSCQ